MSNGLKAVAHALGFSWSDQGASGLQCLAWRTFWEDRQDPATKNRIVTYNAEDCRALEVVTSALREIAPGDGEKIRISKPVAMVESLSHENYVRLLATTAALPEFVRINECSYYTYQRDRVEIRTSPAVRRSRDREARRCRRCFKVDRRVTLTGNGVYLPKHSSSNQISKEGRLMTRCPSCGGSHMLKHNKRTTVRYDLRVNNTGVKRQVTRYVANRYRCHGCWQAFTPEEFKAVARYRYGQTLKSWVTYRNVTLGHSLGTLAIELQDVFELRVGRTQLHKFKSETADRCRDAYEWIGRRIRQSDVVHADETKGKVKEGGGYVWVFSTPAFVRYVHSETRERNLLEDVLAGFKGVLVSDFYAAYDSVDCPQQKCLIHLIRDINDDIFKNPCDEELKLIARGFTDVIAPIVETVDRFGLKKRHLNKHVSSAKRFCGSMDKTVFLSEVAQGYQRRIAKYGDRMFTFLRHNGVSWNNNNAEHAIKRYAILRRGIGMVMNAKGIGEYAVLLSVSETLRRHGANLLEFLLTENLDLGAFLKQLR